MSLSLRLRNTGVLVPDTFFLCFQNIGGFGLGGTLPRELGFLVDLNSINIGRSALLFRAFNLSNRSVIISDEFVSPNYSLFSDK